MPLDICIFRKFMTIHTFCDKAASNKSWSAFWRSNLWCKRRVWQKSIACFWIILFRQ